MPQGEELGSYWSQPAPEVLRALGSRCEGLTSAEVAERVRRCGPNKLVEGRQRSLLLLFIDRFRSPLILILIVAALVAIVVHDWVDAAVVLGIIVISAVLSLVQEHRASRAVEALRRRVQARTTVLRDGQPREVASDELVPGDVVRLAAGSLIPADGLLLATRDFFVSQAILTGETFPVEKQPGVVAPGVILAGRSNCVFHGTSVRSGTATAVITATGRSTTFGRIVDSLVLRPPETELERGLRRFGSLLMMVMGTVVVSVLALNVLLERPIIETLLFAVALAVGLSPELLPAILTVTLARGAQRMAQKGVIVRRLGSIENLGSMDVLCTDKTGTLTAGVVQLDSALDVRGEQSQEVLRLAYLNAHLQQGLANPLDEAIVARAKADGVDADSTPKVDEIPYDFVRKRLSIVVAGDRPDKLKMITKGALLNVLEICDSQRQGDEDHPLDMAARAVIEERFAAWSSKGFRVLGLATKVLPMAMNAAGEPAPPAAGYNRGDERGMTFLGFLLFFDPPEPAAIRTVESLGRLGVQLKIVTGDNRLVARHVAEAVGIPAERIVTGPELIRMTDEALWHLAPEVTLFAEVDPNQKERIIRALQKTGHVVGFLGDGINDAPALHAADVGISVENAVDVARESADFVLLEHDLQVVLEGIEEGRHTFANTLKYIFTTTSANFGNMLSMAFASLFLPFLPLLAKQILLNNFLSDIPAMGIAGDRVDPEWERTPHRWDIGQIRGFMLAFGLVSAAFDAITFAALLYLAGEVPEIFRTGWFLESLLTELCILFVIRTYKPFYQSRPGRFLLRATLVVGLLTLVLPWLPIGGLFGLVPLPPAVLAAVLLITATYMIVSELTKHALYRRISR